MNQSGSNQGRFALDSAKQVSELWALEIAQGMSPLRSNRSSLRRGQKNFQTNEFKSKIRVPASSQS